MRHQAIDQDASITMPIDRSRRNAAFALTTSLLLTVALAGCSSSGSGSGGAATAEGGSTTAASTKPTAAPAKVDGGKLAGVPSACPSADEVMTNLHLSSLVVSGGDASLCQYLFNADKASPYVVITFNAVPSFTPAMLESGLTQGQSNVKAVSGLADAAFAFTPSGGGAGAGLTFLSGDTVCSIVTTVATTADGEIALARSILQG
jgi:hypothetical protein